jgi:hypothetical protein
MSPRTNRLFASAATLRLAAIAGLLGAGLLAAPLTASAHMRAHHQTSAAAMQESVEQRITRLHTDLSITPAEEADWNGVAQTMRDNEVQMQKLVADQSALAPHSVNAVQDLETYEKFTEAHVQGLKALISSFETLYNAMPDSQKLVADHVFEKFSHKRALSHA